MKLKEAVDAFVKAKIIDVDPYSIPITSYFDRLIKLKEDRIHDTSRDGYVKPYRYAVSPD
jgi:hypothetical protein